MSLALTRVVVSTVLGRLCSSVWCMYLRAGGLVSACVLSCVLWCEACSWVRVECGVGLYTHSIAGEVVATGWVASALPRPQALRGTRHLQTRALRSGLRLQEDLLWHCRNTDPSDPPPAELGLPWPAAQTSENSGGRGVRARFTDGETGPEGIQSVRAECRAGLSNALLGGSPALGLSFLFCYTVQSTGTGMAEAQRSWGIAKDH